MVGLFARRYVPSAGPDLGCDEESGKVLCLVEAPDAEAAMTVHREAHGLVADSIVPVQEGF